MRPDQIAHELNIRERAEYLYHELTNLAGNFLLIGARLIVTRLILGKLLVCVTKTVAEEIVACVLFKR